MSIERKCKTCGANFYAIKDTQFFCSRRCFKKAYYYRNKDKIKEQNKRTPTFLCPVCHNESNLGFDPIRQEYMFDVYICPFCGIPRVTMLKQQIFNTNFVIGNNRTINFVISSAIISHCS